MHFYQYFFGDDKGDGFFAAIWGRSAHEFYCIRLTSDGFGSGVPLSTEFSYSSPILSSSAPAQCRCVFLRSFRHHAQIRPSVVLPDISESLSVVWGLGRPVMGVKSNRDRGGFPACLRGTPIVSQPNLWVPPTPEGEAPTDFLSIFDL